jgi:hypothetical protein
MFNRDKWIRAVWRFNRFSGALPRTVTAEHVDKYHSIVSELEEASGIGLSAFRIPGESQSQCELSFLEAKVVGLKRFLKTIAK